VNLLSEITSGIYNFRQKRRLISNIYIRNINLIDFNPNIKEKNNLAQTNNRVTNDLANRLPEPIEKPINSDHSALHNPEIKLETKLVQSNNASSENSVFSGINTWLQSFYNKNKTQVDKLDKIMFDDASWVRKVLSLENELAEALEPSMKQLKVPEGITKFVYKGLWALCYFNTGMRMFMEAVKNGDAISGIKKLVQDFVSVITLTTYFARALNWLQDKVEDAIGIPSIVKNLFRPPITVLGCGKAIDYFDKVGGPAGDFAVNMLRKISSGKSTPQLSPQVN
jgi:hypothetical protein